VKDKAYYKLLMETLDEACKNAAIGSADIGRLNSMCIETQKRASKLTQ